MADSQQQQPLDEAEGRGRSTPERQRNKQEQHKCTAAARGIASPVRGRQQQRSEQDSSARTRNATELPQQTPCAASAASAPGGGASVPGTPEHAAPGTPSHAPPNTPAATTGVKMETEKDEKDELAAAMDEMVGPEDMFEEDDDTESVDSEELIISESEAEKMPQNMPVWFNTTVKVQSKQNRQDFRKIIDKKMKSYLNPVKNHLRKQQRALIAQGAAIALATTKFDTVADEVAELRRVTLESQRRIADLEAKAAASSNLPSAPLGAFRFQPHAANTSSSSNMSSTSNSDQLIDRAKLYVGGWIQVPAAVIRQQILKIIEDCNTSKGCTFKAAYIGLGSGLCDYAWLKFEPSDGLTAQQVAWEFKVYLDNAKIKPVGDAAPGSGNGAHLLWCQPQRTQQERDKRRALNRFRRFLHLTREKHAIGEKYTVLFNNEPYHFQLVGGDYRKGKECVKWHGIVVAKLDGNDNILLESNQILSNAIGQDIPSFDPAGFRAEWEAWISNF